MGEVVRLFAVEGRTELERQNTRRAMTRAQAALFEAAEVEPVSCPVCGGGHAEHECQHGTAPTLADLDELAAGIVEAAAGLVQRIAGPSYVVEPARSGGGWDVVAEYPSGTVTRVGHHGARYRAVQYAEELGRVTP